MENEALIKTSTLIAIADAIRAANGGTQEMLPAEMEAFIRANSATTADIVDAVRSTAKDSTITAEQAAAYIVSNFVKPSVRQAAKTWTPGTSDQSIAAGTYLSGEQTIKGDSKLTAGNIKKGVSIFGKTGTLSGIFGDPSAFYTGFSAVKSGSITLSAYSSQNVVITHNLGVMPKFILVYPSAKTNVNQGGSYRFAWAMVYQLCTVGDISYTVAADDIFFSAHGEGSSNLYVNRFYNGDKTSSSNTYARTLTSTNASPSRDNWLRATTSTFTILASSTYTVGMGTYKWLVMG
jgi:hypothetical protein